VSGQEWKIRRYEPGDADVVWEWHVLGLKDVGAYTEADPWDDDLRDIAGAYINGRGEFLVAVIDGDVVGMGRRSF
jgi:hypothetical protein